MPFATYLTVTCAFCGCIAVCTADCGYCKSEEAGSQNAGRSYGMYGYRTSFILPASSIPEIFSESLLSRKPVAVVKAEIMGKLLKAAPDAACRYTAIPYSAVGTEKGDYGRIQGGYYGNQGDDHQKSCAGSLRKL